MHCPASNRRSDAQAPPGDRNPEKEAAVLVVGQPLSSRLVWWCRGRPTQPLAPARLPRSGWGLALVSSQVGQHSQAPPAAAGPLRGLRGPGAVWWHGVRSPSPGRGLKGGCLPVSTRPGVPAATRPDAGRLVPFPGFYAHSAPLSAVPGCAGAPVRGCGAMLYHIGA